MKKKVSIIAIVVIVIVAASVAIPYFFKPGILEYAKTALNKQLNANVEVRDLKLSLLRNFPKLSLELRDLSVVGAEGSFRNDTLFSARELRTSTNIKSLFQPSNMELSEIVLQGASIHLIAAANGDVNWELGADDGSTTADTDETEAKSDFRLQLDNVEIRDGVLRYEDRASDMVVLLGGIDFDISGRMFGSVSQLKTTGKVANFNVAYGGINYVANTTLGLTTLLDVDFDKMLFTIAENELLVNRLPLEVSGSFRMPNDTVWVDMKVASKNSDFENFLALVPPVYEPYLKDIQTTGSATISGTISGSYFGEDYPEIQLLAKVDNGNFRYAGMPEEIKNISAEIVCSKPQGILDKMKVSIGDAHAEIRNNPVDLTLTLSELVSDPFFDATLIGKVNLSDLKNALPIDSVDMSGVVDANIVAQGRYSSVEREAYENIKTDGKVLLTDFGYQSPDLSQKIIVPKGQLDFSPQKINLSHFQLQIGESDFSLTGAVSNYLAYLFSEGTLNGDLNLNSKYTNIDELLRLQINDNDAELEPETKTEDAADEILAFDVPPHVNFTLQSAVKKAVFNRVLISDIAGVIKAQNEKLSLENLDMNLLEGSLTLDGSYQNTPQNQPLFDFGVDVSKIDIPTMYNTLSGIRKIVPMAGSSTGKISTDLRIQGNLSPQLGLVSSTINGGGTFSTSDLEIVDSPVFNQLSGILKKEQLRNIKVDDFMANISVTDGNLLLKPFSTRVIGQETTVEGSLNVDNLLSMHIDFMVEREMFGPDIQKILAVIPGNEKIKVLPAGVDIAGPVGGPKVKPDLSKTTKAVTEATKDDVQKSLDNLGKDILKMFGK